MKVWRICREEYANLSGIGASLYGGQWNSQGHPAIYTASTLSLAFLEILPSLRKSGILKRYVSLEIMILEQATKEEIFLEDYPFGWREGKGTQWFAQQGDRWIKSKQSLLLMGSSGIFSNEYNIINNPEHPGIAEVKIIQTSPFHIDKRLI